ncbi:hypothetical protein O6H91_16G030000 [Diphasiastrum complanatum]|uniref:Uncharacterized protein n=1 Tax=Diphasiastrum complanatum TaxID=34168 RepID=A0ACC2BB26_DIPCM|nr:hypothetical protein O6H91_16G030000 [Diphasiastrum complanatum]
MTMHLLIFPSSIHGISILQGATEAGRGTKFATMTLWKKISKKFFEKKQKKEGVYKFIIQFEGQKETISKEIEERKGELREKVVDIYKVSETRVQLILKEPADCTIEEHALHVLNLVQELAKAGFPGASILSESLARYGASTLPGPTNFLLLKASDFVKEEPAPVKEAFAVEKFELPAEAAEKPLVAETEAALEAKPAKASDELVPVSSKETVEPQL